MKIIYPKKEKITIIIAVFIEIGILGYFLLFNQLRFYSNDDTLKVALAGGAYGQPSMYLGYNTVHIALGYLLKIAFTVAPIINWISVLYILVNVISVTLLHFLLITNNKDANKELLLLSTLIVNAYFYFCLATFTFTVTAYTAAITGGVTLFMAINNDKRHEVYLGVAFIILAGLLRYMVCYSILIVLFIISFYYLIYNKNRKGILICAGCVVVVFTMKYSNSLIVGRNSIQKEYYNIVSSKIEAMDAKQLSWEENSAELEKLGISEDIYNILYGARYIDRDIQNIHNYNVINTLNEDTNNKYNTDIKSYLNQLLGFLLNVNDKSSFYKVYYWLIVLYAIIFYNNKRDKVLMGLCPLVVESIFILRNRDLYRVTMPVYFFVLMLMISMCLQDRRVHADKVKQTTRRLCCLIICGTVVVSTIAFNKDRINTFNYDISDEANVVIKYMEARQNVIFFPISSDMYSLEVYRPVFSFAGQNGRCFFCGDGASLSEAYYSAISNYNVSDYDRPIFDAINNEGACFIGNSNEELANQLYEPILNYLEEKTGTNLKLVTNERLTNSFSAYRLISQ